MVLTMATVASEWEKILLVTPLSGAMQAQISEVSHGFPVLSFS